MKLNSLIVNVVEMACELLRTEMIADCTDKHGTELEPVVANAIKKASESFPEFEIKVQLISGQKFPDIVLIINDHKFGIEVKTTKSDKWVTLGGSITESTKVDDLVDIYVLFGRTNVSPPEFRFRRFSECASSVTITHSPRFTIDMDTPQGETVFEHIGIPYEVLNARSDKMSLYRKFLKEKVGPNADVWWLDGETGSEGSNGFSTDAIRSFESLSPLDREKLKIEILAIFPELFDLKSSYKYHSATRYIAARYGIVDHCFRDRFTSGGKVPWSTYGSSVPKIIENLIYNDRLTSILERLDELPIEVLAEYWGVAEHIINRSGRRRLWVDFVTRFVGRNDSALADHLRPVLSSHLNQ